ncbi:MAG: hypothetical protein ACU0C9_10685, partial [Paracoccaceae bacterium]
AFLIVLLPLVACATPQQQCIANAGKDIRVLSGLINTTQANINRGYGLRTEEFLENENQLCGVVNGEKVYCSVAVANSREVPVALDLTAEAAKLNSLLQKRGQLSSRTNAVIAECRLHFPEA